MKVISLALPLFAFVALAAAEALDFTKSPVFDAAIGGDKAYFVDAFAPWCGHCKKLAPTWDQLGAAYAKSAGVGIAKVDADANRELGQKLGLKSYPSLYWFDKGSKTPEPYSGGRDLDSLKKFVDEKLGKKSKPAPPAVLLELDAGNFDKIALDTKKDAFVAFTAPWCGHCKTLKPKLETVAQTFENDDDCVVAFYDADAAANRPIAERYNVEGYPTLLFFPKGDEKHEVYKGERSEEALADFINKRCNVHRKLGGALDEFAGRLPAMDGLAARFWMAQDKARTDVYNEAKEFVERMTSSETAVAAKNEAAQYYMKVMDKVTASPDYVAKETARLASLLKKHADGSIHLASKKVDELTRKSNILANFKERKMSEEARKKIEEATKPPKDKAHEEL